MLATPDEPVADSGLTLALSQPQSPFALPVFAFSNAPATAGPCGLVLPGVGELEPDRLRTPCA